MTFGTSGSVTRSSAGMPFRISRRPISVGRPCSVLDFVSSTTRTLPCIGGLCGLVSTSRFCRPFWDNKLNYTNRDHHHNNPRCFQMLLLLLLLLPLLKLSLSHHHRP